jgi:hypothetical protein
MVGGVGIMNKRLQGKRNAEIAPTVSNFPPPMRPQQYNGVRKNSMRLKLIHKAPTQLGVETTVQVGGSNLALPQKFNLNYAESGQTLLLN